MIGGDLRNQVRWCGRTLCLDPLQPQVLELAGQAHAELGDALRSADLLRRALAIDPSGTRQASFAVSEVLTRAGRSAAAVPFAWWAAASAPNQPMAQVRLAMVAGQAERWGLAAAAALNACRVLPQLPELAVTAVVAAREAGRGECPFLPPPRPPQMSIRLMRQPGAAAAQTARQMCALLKTRQIALGDGK